METSSEVLTTADVARRLNVTPERVRQLDGVLCPLRLSNGSRVYLRSSIEAFAQARAR